MQNYEYTPINKSWATKFLDSHSDLDVMAARPSPSYGSRFRIGEFSITNNSGSTAIIGIGGRIASDLWTFREWDESDYAAGAVYTDDTVDAQDSGAGDVTLEVVGTNSDGFVIGCDIPFNIASLVISQASASNAAYTVHYSIASAGTGFSNNFATLSNMHVSPSFGSTGEQLLWFDPPADWHKATEDTLIVNRHGRSSVQVAGLTPPSQYLLVVKAATAPDTTPALMTICTLGHMVMTKRSIANAGVMNNIGGVEFGLPPQCDAIMPAISVANAANRATIMYRYSG